MAPESALVGSRFFEVEHGRVSAMTSGTKITRKFFAVSWTTSIPWTSPTLHRAQQSLCKFGPTMSLALEQKQTLASAIKVPIGPYRNTATLPNLQLLNVESVSTIFFCFFIIPSPSLRSPGTCSEMTWVAVRVSKYEMVTWMFMFFERTLAACFRHFIWILRISSFVVWCNFLN